MAFPRLANCSIAYVVLNNVVKDILIQCYTLPNQTLPENKTEYSFRHMVDILMKNAGGLRVHAQVEHHLGNFIGGFRSVAHNPFPYNAVGAVAQKADGVIQIHRIHPFVTGQGDIHLLHNVLQHFIIGLSGKILGEDNGVVLPMDIDKHQRLPNIQQRVLCIGGDPLVDFGNQGEYFVDNLVQQFHLVVVVAVEGAAVDAAGIADFLDGDVINVPGLHEL